MIRIRVKMTDHVIHLAVNLIVGELYIFFTLFQIFYLVFLCVRDAGEMRFRETSILNGNFGPETFLSICKQPVGGGFGL